VAKAPFRAPRFYRCHKGKAKAPRSKIQSETYGFFGPACLSVSAGLPPDPALKAGLVLTNKPPILPAVIDRIGGFNNASVPPRGQSGQVGFGFFPGGKPQAVANPLTGLSSCLRCPGHHSSFHGVGIMTRTYPLLPAAEEGLRFGALWPMRGPERLGGAF
jgi:hypothetical protein